MSDLIFAIVSGFGLLALSIGAFGVLDAYNKRGVGERRVDWLVALYALGVTMNIVAYVMLDRWYIAAPLALMLWPAERAFDKRGTFKRRTAKVDALTGRS
jgi:hypothetical protein